jgi:hypothetical protein
MPARAPAALIVIGLAIAGAGAAAQKSPPSAAFGLGVLRRDGVVIPFAHYDGKWRSSWPPPKDQVDVPIDLRNVPSRWWGKTGALATWQAWVGAEPPRPITVRQPDWFPAHCVRQIGLRTDYRSAEPPPEPGMQPFPKDGLAVSPPHEIERIEVVPVSHLTPEPVAAAFNEAEDAFVRQRGLETHLPARMRRSDVVPKIEAIYGTGDPHGMRIYYIELSKEYRNDLAPACPIVSYGGGWFVREGPGALQKLRFDVQFTDCERYGLLYMLPLGALRLSDRLYWAAQWSGWDYEEYSVIAITPKKVEDVIRVWGGGC